MPNNVILSICFIQEKQKDIYKFKKLIILIKKILLNYDQKKQIFKFPSFSYAHNWCKCSYNPEIFI